MAFREQLGSAGLHSAAWSHQSASASLPVVRSEICRSTQDGQQERAMLMGGGAASG